MQCQHNDVMASLAYHSYVRCRCVNTMPAL
jgi:hypothetical protein